MSVPPSQRSNSSRATPPKWRSSLSSPRKQKPSAGVSVVFAQPEPGARLGSAIDRLPVVAADDAVSIYSVSSRKRERLNSNASSFVSSAEQRSDREREQMERKRSRLNLDVGDDLPNGGDRTAADGMLSADVPGSALNPVDLTESPKPMDTSLPPSVQPDEVNSESHPPADLHLQTQGEPQSEPQSREAVPLPSADTGMQQSIGPATSTASRSSWFRFSRAKASDNSSQTISAPLSTTSAVPTTSSSESGSGSDSTASPSVPSVRRQDPGASDIRPETVDLSSSPPAHAVPVTSPPRAIPQLPSSMTFPSVAYSPPTPTSTAYLKSNTTSISSVDEEVPVLQSSVRTITPQAVVEPHESNMRAAGRKLSVSSLNPSASRFTLRLPLLGRPKVPLEQAVASVQAEDVREAVSGGEPAKSDDGATADGPVSARDGTPMDTSELAPNVSGTSTPSAPQVVNVIPPTPGSEPADPSSSHPLSETQGEEREIEAAKAPDDLKGAMTVRTASWWDYVSWRGQGSSDAQGEAQDQPAEGVEDATKNAELKDQAAQPTEQPSSSASVTEPQTSLPESQGEASSLATATQHEAQDTKSVEKPSSIRSGETAHNHGPSWYSPWAWYPSGHASTAHVAEPPSTDSPAAQKTEAEMVKEKALARDEERRSEQDTQAQPEPGPAPPVHSPTSPLEATNPIQSSIADNRTGWMSFFMSKSLTVRTVTDGTVVERSEGMEVMEIDDEPDPDVAVEVCVGDNGPKGTDIPAQGVPKKKPSELVLSTSPKPPSLASSAPIPNSPKTPKSPTVSKSSAKSPPPSKSPTKAPAKEKEREPKKHEPAPPLTDSESVKRGTRTPSPTPSGATGTPPLSAKPNLVLPTWEDTFHVLPRSEPPPRPHGARSKLTGALSYVASALFSAESGLVKGKGKGKGKATGKDADGYGTWASPTPTQQEQGEFVTFGQELPKALDVVGEMLNPYTLNGGCRVVVIGVAGWSPGAVTRTLAGGLPSSSSKFVNMTVQALEQFADEGGFKFKKITPMALEGDGTIRKKVSRVYNHLLESDEWMEDLHAADVIFVASHSQGAVVSTHLAHRLIEDGHILTSRSVDTLAKSAAAIAAGGAAAVPTGQAQRVCLLALCGIHLGPLRYMKTSSLLQPYIQYVENAAARELFEFQNTESNVSKNYVEALRNVLDHGTKVVYIASLNDQVVPIYSGLFTAASHPRILRALYIDNDAYHSSDFLSNLLILLIRILNAGLSDRGLLAHLSEATAGTLSGIGHSTAYEELATYSLAVKYFFMTNDGTASDTELVIHPFNAVEEQNDYEIPWLLRDMIADHKISHFFAHEFSQLRDAFSDWQPKTTILRDVKKKLQPITRLKTTAPQTSGSISKL